MDIDCALCDRLHHTESEQGKFIRSYGGCIECFFTPSKNNPPQKQEKITETSFNI